MGGIKITELPTSTTPLSGSEIVPLVQGGVTKNATVTQIGTVTATGTTTPRTLPDRFAETVSVKDFGAVGDGVTDDTAAIQAAVDYAASIGRGAVRIPAGWYKTTAAINVMSGSIAILGDGCSVVAILPTNPTAHTFKFGGTTFDSSISALRILYTGSTTPTSGAGVYQTGGTAVITVRDVRIENTYNGIECENASVAGVVLIDTAQIANYVNDGIVCKTNISQLTISNVNTYQAQLPGYGGNAGINIAGGGLVVIDNTVCGGGTIGLLVRPPSGTSIFDLFATNFEVDSYLFCGIWIDTTTGGGKINGSLFTNCRVGYGQGPGWVFDGPNNNFMQFHNCNSVLNTKEGLVINNGNKLSFHGFSSIGNSVAGLDAYYGVKITGGQDISFIGGISGKHPDFAGNQAAGLAITDTFTGSLLVDGFNVRAGNTVGISNSSPATTGIRIINCVGFNPVGMSYPVVGASPWSYRAGVSHENVIMNGGTISSITIAGVAIPVAAFVSFLLAPQQLMVVTYTVAPNVAVNAM